MLAAASIVPALVVRGAKRGRPSAKPATPPARPSGDVLAFRPERGTPERLAKAVGVVVEATEDNLSTRQRVRSVVEDMAARGRLSPDEAAVAQRLAELHHAAGLEGVRAQDLTRPSAAGTVPCGLPRGDRMIQARRDWRKVMDDAGTYFGRVLVMIVLEDRTLAEAGALLTGRSADVASGIAGDRLVEGLRRAGRVLGMPVSA